MICHKKRKFILFSAFFALINSLLIIVLNALILANRVLADLAEEGTETLIDGLGIDLLTDIQTYTNGLESSFKVFNIALIVVGFIGLILAIKAFKKPIKADGTVTYRPFNQLFTLVISVVLAIFAFIGSQDEAMSAETLLTTFLPIICYVILAIAAVSILFEIFAIFTKKNIYKTKTVITPKNKQKVALSVLGVEEKLQKIEQLKEVGIINEAQYNAAVIRIINGI